MANRKITEESEVEVMELDQIEDEGIAPTDFIIVFDHEGNLKSVLMPDGAEDHEIPNSIMDILKDSGIDDVTDLQPHTLH